MNFPARIAAVLFVLASPVWGATRLAIVADDDSQPVADALATGLSTHKELELAGPDEVAKALKEHALPANATAAQELDFAKALRAQAVLFLDVQKGTDKPVMHARLFSSQQSVTLFDSTAAFAAWKTNLLSGLVEERVARLIPKLGDEPGKLLPVSTGEISAVASLPQGLGAAATALLRSRMSAEPGIIVQERLSLDLLSTESTPADEASKKYWSQEWVVDGSVEAGSKEGVVAIHLKLHRPDGSEAKTFTAEGAPGALKDLVAKAAGDVLRDLDQPAATAWDPNADARQFVDDIVWAKKLGENQTALAMADEACALGGDARGEALFLQASLNTSKARSWGVRPNEKKLSLMERYDSAMKALAAGQAYIDGKFPSDTFEMKQKYGGQANVDFVREMIVEAASEVLVELTDDPKQDGPPREPLRQALRKLLPFDPRAGKLPEDGDISYFASYWADNPDELIDYYCASMQSGEVWQKETAAHSLRRFVKFHEAVFNGIGPGGYFIGPERQYYIMDSAPPGTSRFPDAATVFDRLTKKLADNASTRVAAYLIRSSGSAPLDEKKEWFDKFLNEFWDRREQLMKEGRYADWLGIVMELDPEVQSEYPEQQAKLLRYFLVNGGKSSDLFFMSLWKPATFPADQAADIWKEFNAYRERIKDTPPHSRLDPYAKSFLDQFPAYKTAVAASSPAPEGATPVAVKDDPLVVAGWHPYGGAGAAGEHFITLGATVAEGKLWVWGRYVNDPKAVLIGIDLETFKAQEFDIASAGSGNVLVTPDAFYVTNGSPPDTSTLSRYDRKRKTWETKPIPGGAVALLNGSFYLDLFGLKNNVGLGGLARYDWDSGKVTYLADIHRKPTLNQIDKIEPFALNGVFEGPGRKICAVIGVPYYVRDDPGDWEKLDVQPGVKSPDMSVSILDGKVLLMSPAGDWIYYYEPGAKALETWIAPQGKALWDQPPEMQNHGGGFPLAHFGIIPGGMMWIKPLPDSPYHFEMRWFQRNGQRVGEKMTLLLKSDNAPDSKPFGGFYYAPQGTVPSAAMNTEKGIVLWNDGYGFWFVPYADIEAHLKKNQISAHAPSR